MSDEDHIDTDDSQERDRPKIIRREKRPHVLLDSFNELIQRHGEAEPKVTGEQFGVDHVEWDVLAGDLQQAKKGCSDYVVTEADLDDLAKIFELCRVEQLEGYFRDLAKRYSDFFDFRRGRPDVIDEWMRIIRCRGMRLKDLHGFRIKLAEILTEDPKFKWSNLIAYITRNVRSSSEYQAAQESPQMGKPVTKLTLIARAAG